MHVQRALVWIAVLVLAGCGDEPKTPPQGKDAPPPQGNLDGGTLVCVASREDVPQGVSWSVRRVPGDLRPPAPARLRVQAHASVFVMWGDQVAAGTSTPTRAFEARDLDVGSYVVSATRGDGTHVAKVVHMPLRGVRMAVALDLPTSTHAVRGRMLRADGTPMQGVVYAGKPNQVVSVGGVEPWLWTTLDRQGRFQLRGLPLVEVRLGLHRDGTVEMEGWKVATTLDEEIELKAPAPRTYAGAVVTADTRAPVAGAAVRVVGPTEGGTVWFADATTDDKGAFQVQIAGDEVTHAAAADGYAAAEPGNDPATVALEPLGDLEVRCHASTGDGPVSWMCRLTSDLRMYEVQTDGPVAHFAGLSPGSYRIEVRGDGWFGLGRAYVEGGTALPAEVQVQRGRTVRGTVLGPDGQPVGGALVVAMGRQLRTLGVTDARGRFHLEGVTPETYALRVGYVPDAWHDGIEALRREDDAPVSVRLVRPHFVRVHVKTEAGEPVRFATVTPLDERGADVGGHRLGATMTDDMGFARVGPLAARPASIRVDAPGWLARPAAAPRPVERADRSAAEIRMPSGGIVAGRVLYADGVPVPGVTVSVNMIGTQANLHGVVRTDEEGAFRIRGVPKGRVRISTDAERALFDTHTGPKPVYAAAGDEEVELRLTRPSRDGPYPIEVRVTDAQGRPVPRAVITGGVVEDGIATIQDGRDLTFVEAWHARSKFGRALPLGRARVPVPSGARSLKIVMPPERVITGVVRVPEGVPAGGFRVSAAPPGMRADGWALTDRAGRFRVRGLGAGPHTVRVEIEDPALLAPAPQEAQAGATGLTFDLGRAPSVVVQVVDEDDRPIAGAWVRATALRHEPGTQVGVPSDAQGRATLHRVTTKRPHEELIVQAEGYFPERIRDWTPADTTVKLRRAYVIAGIVRDQHGTARPDVRVALLPEGKLTARWLVTRTNDRGAFTFRDLEPGSYELAVMDLDEVPGRHRRSTPSRMVRAGTTDVDVSFEREPDVTLPIENWPAGATPAPAFLWPHKRSRTHVPNHIVSKAADGSVTFKGVRSDRKYELWIGPVAESWYAHIKDFVHQATMAIELKKGLTIRGTVASRDDQTPTEVRVQGFTELVAPVDGQGRFVLKCVPPGSHKIAVTVLEGGSYRYPTREVEAGATVELDVRKHR